ncbi:MAG: dipeptide ABC transporter ATP-binding protein [Alphaproteobacteria bacterium]
MESLLDIKGLNVSFHNRYNVENQVLKDIHLKVKRGEILGIVGESGAGKSTIAAAIAQLLPLSATIGEEIDVTFEGACLNEMSLAQIRAYRGKQIGMIFQDPMVSLDPLFTIGDQLVETIQQHLKLPKSEAKNLALDWLKRVEIKDAKQRLSWYPHQLSGGQRQRVVIALALCSKPSLIIADEPTTALDVGIQKQILTLIKRLATEENAGVILITHDISVIAAIANRVMVLRAGETVEIGDVQQILGHPKEEYTTHLMAAVPRLEKKLHRFNIPEEVEYSPKDEAYIDAAHSWLLAKQDEIKQTDKPILDIKNLSVCFRENKDILWAVKNASFHISKGDILGIVGESGSGKSTLIRSIVGLVPKVTGNILFYGEDIDQMTLKQYRQFRSHILGMIFQDPYSSLNNRKNIFNIISEPMRVQKTVSSKQKQKELVAGLLSLCGMSPDMMSYHPHQFSGGQRQRIAIARALASRPSLLICDEPTSALDVSVQARILNLLKDLQEQLSLSILFVTHDLPVARQMCNKIIVMDQGEIKEEQETESFFNNPQSLEGRELLASLPSTTMLDG